jgi:pimeloyl-ACP methyl ester carboxylesterase
MMTKLQLTLDVSHAAALPGPLHLAATVYLPEANTLLASPIAIFAVPGGGYSRGYFDMHFDGHAQYSEAAYHTARGFIFVALDHLGVGNSTIPDLGSISFGMLAATYDAAVRDLSDRLLRGTLDPSLPPLPQFTKIGIGQSMGGCVTILTQSAHRTFDAIAPLGYSAIHTMLPQPTEQARHAAMLGHNSFQHTAIDKLSIRDSSTHVMDFRYPFHWEDVPQDVLDADMSGGYPIRISSPPFGSLTIPNCALHMMAPGCVRSEAAMIDVPVLIGVGERDVCPDPHAEPGAYGRSYDVSLFVVPRMAHMHNFASTRMQLWQRLEQWARAI